MNFMERLKSYQVGFDEVALIKLSVFAITLMIAKLWDPILSLDWYWYLIISLVAGVKPMKSFFQYSETADASSV